MCKYSIFESINFNVRWLLVINISFVYWVPFSHSATKEFQKEYEETLLKKTLFISWILKGIWRRKKIFCICTRNPLETLLQYMKNENKRKFYKSKFITENEGHINKKQRENLILYMKTVSFPLIF